MARILTNSTPRQDGFRMPAEFELQERVWMLWPQRPDNWRDGGKPAQKAYADVAEAISRFTPVTMCVNSDQYQNARAQLPSQIQVIEMSSNDAWMRDVGPSFLVNDHGELRACDWRFNAWGGLVDGIDPEETNGHVDDVACFVRPGEAACIYTEDTSSPFYETARKCMEF